MGPDDGGSQKSFVTLGLVGEGNSREPLQVVQQVSGDFEVLPGNLVM